MHVPLAFSQVLVLQRRPTKVYQENIDQVLSRPLMENVVSYSLCFYVYVVA